MAESFWLPREEFTVPEGAEETALGDPKGCIRQYRLGRLHIREYKDGFELHRDKADPRRDPVGHLMRDAPGYVALGIGAAIAGGLVAYLAMRR